MKKILIIEANTKVRDTYVSAFKAKKFETIEARDGHEALTLIHKERPDVILLEILLPKIDGFEVLRKIRATHSTKDTPVVLFTDLGHEDDMKRCYQLGIHEYCINAHNTPAQIVHKVKEILKGK